jgi:LysR substrate binding domain
VLNVRVEGQLVVNEIALALQAALDGLGIAYLPEDYVRADIKAGRMMRVLESWCPPFPGYHLYYPSRRHQSPAFTLLVEALRYRIEPAGLSLSSLSAASSASIPAQPYNPRAGRAARTSTANTHDAQRCSVGSGRTFAPRDRSAFRWPLTVRRSQRAMSARRPQCFVHEGGLQ